MCHRSVIHTDLCGALFFIFPFICDRGRVWGGGGGLQVFTPLPTPQVLDIPRLEYSVSQPNA